jgi:hypothetical protein
MIKYVKSLSGEVQAILLSDSCTLNHRNYVLEGFEYHLVIHDAEYVFSRVPMNSGPRGIPLPTL